MRFFSLLYSKDWFWKHSSAGKKEYQQIAYIHNFVDQIIDNRRTELLNGDGLKEKETDKERPVLLDILLKSELDGKPLSNEDIRAEVNTFMFAVRFFVLHFYISSNKLLLNRDMKQLEQLSDFLSTFLLNIQKYRGKFCKRFVT